MGYEKMKYQKAILERNPVFKLMEAAHLASFKNGLSNPLVSPGYAIGKHNTDMLMDRMGNSYFLKNMVLVGAGVDQETLEEAAEAGTAKVEILHDGPLEFAGKEVHLNEHQTNVSHVALCYQGLAIGDSDNAALSVLQHVLGTRGNVKRGSELERGILNKQVDEYVDDYQFSTSAANINYSNTGMFVVHVASESDAIDTVTRATAAELAKIAASPQSIDEVAFQAGKNRCLSKIAMDYENGDVFINDTAVHALTLNQKLNKDHVLQQIAEVSADDLNRVATKILTGKMSLASLGPTNKMPSLQDCQY